MTKEEIGQVIKESRISAGFTQLQVAKMLERPQQTLASWEAGRSQPDANTLFELFRVLGRSVDEAFGFTVESFNITAREREHIEKYRALDAYGQDTVSAVLGLEYKRCVEQAQAYQEQPEQDNVVYITNWFPMLMSAGTGQPAGNDEPEELLLTKRPPRGTSYVAPVSGNSMEPTYRDGDRLFIRAQTFIEQGQVGVFFMDGQQWVKQLGDGVLLSHNPAYAPIPMRGDIRCQGLVLGICDESYFR